MSLWSTINNNKVAAALTVTAVSLGGLLAWAYKNYKQEISGQVEVGKAEVSSSSPLKKPQQINIQDEINRLKQEIDFNNLTMDDVKAIFTTLANYVKSKTLAISNKFKQDRRKRFPHQSRLQNLGDYLKYTGEGLMKLQQTIMQLQTEQTQLMSSLGLTQAKLAPFSAQLGAFMQQLVFDSNISLDDVRKSLQLKTEYLEDHGERIIEALIELSPSLSLQDKQVVPLFINIIISDEAFEHEPELDKQEFDMAYQKYKNSLNAELTKLEKVLIPLMGKLQTALAGDQMGGLGGFGGVGSYPSEYENMGGDMSGFGGMDMGGMGGMGMGGSEEMMMQQIQMLRQQDPEKFEQLMAMMQGQMMG